jgi:GTP-binding protein EngB required for normal cell division
MLLKLTADSTRNMEVINSSETPITTVKTRSDKLEDNNQNKRTKKKANQKKTTQRISRASTAAGVWICAFIST